MIKKFLIHFSRYYLIRKGIIGIEFMTTKFLGFLGVLKLFANIPKAHETASCRWSCLIKYGDNIEIGENSRIGPKCVLGAKGNIVIGRNVVISREVQLETAGLDLNVGPPYTRHVSKPIYIGDNCWLGSGVIVLAGVSIGANSIIGAGTVITKDIPENSIVVGAKVRKIK